MEIGRHIRWRPIFFVYSPLNRNDCRKNRLKSLNWDKETEDESVGIYKGIS